MGVSQNYPCRILKWNHFCLLSSSKAPWVPEGRSIPKPSSKGQVSRCSSAGLQVLKCWRVVFRAGLRKGPQALEVSENYTGTLVTMGPFEKYPLVSSMCNPEPESQTQARVPRLCSLFWHVHVRKGSLFFGCERVYRAGRSPRP